MIKVHLVAWLGHELGVNEVEVEAPTVSKLLKELSARFGQPFDSRARVCKVIVNGTNVAFLKGGGTRLADGDDVTLLPPLAGG
jgi:molybdopterin converting factor small subunit